MRYADSNVEAWAQYYAQGGKDPTGAVYFISVPGVKDFASEQTGIVTAVDPNLGSAQSLSRRESLYEQHGNTVTDGRIQGAGDDLELENPYERYGPGGMNQNPVGGGANGPGYGASPYPGLTRDVAGMDIKG